MKDKEVRRRAFVLRVWQDPDGQIWGQLNEPICNWQRPFADQEELWTTLLARLDLPITGRALTNDESIIGDDS